MLFKKSGKLAAGAVLALMLAVWGPGVQAQSPARSANVSATKHNLSVSGPGSVKSASVAAGGTTEVCVFCHTPHGASGAATPLWNRQLNSTYTKYYDSSQPGSINSLDLKAADYAVQNSSRLCLTCHDGTQAIGSVSNRPGSGAAAGTGIPHADKTKDNIAMTTADMKMPAGSEGYTRNLSTDLRNDHPISFAYNAALYDRVNNPTTADTELRTLGAADVVIGGKQAPLRDGRIECAACHDPHLYTADTTANNSIKFLRLNRFQASSTVTAFGANFSPANDISCLACHDKAGWSDSAHAVSTVAYTSTGASNREFPSATTVWKAACLNCHDTHTTTGARRLLRAGSDGATPPGSAIENTCYQCHITSTSSAVTVTSGNVPNIQGEFARARRMPIVKADQGGGGAAKEEHDITTADFVEVAATLGSTSNAMRHAECTDCHNPHRVMKNSKFYGTTTDGNSGKRTHDTGGAEGNIASGALRGAWGVEPTSDFSGQWPKASAWAADPVKKGQPGTDTAKSNSYLTREYQLCFKCHSDYGSKGLTKVVSAVTYGLPDATGPALGPATQGRTPSGTNSLSFYTNVAAEFSSVNATDSPTGSRDQGEFGKCTSGCVANYTDFDPAGSLPADTTGAQMADDTGGTHNHRSWHPVMYPTGRSWAERRIEFTANANFRAPFNGTTSPNGLGLQTMHCSDCHGADGSWTQGQGPTATAVQGPHGSDNNFLLRSTGDSTAGANVWSSSNTFSSPGFCGNCHNPNENGTNGTGDAGANRRSGFNAASSEGGGGHGNAHDSRRCQNCHIAIPHGWKNKAFLVNLNCRGEEDGVTTCNDTTGYAGLGANSSGASYSSGPYYNSAFLRVFTWRASGNWAINSCGYSGNTSRAWMKDGAAC